MDRTCTHDHLIDRRRYVHDDGPDATLMVGEIHCLCGASWQHRQPWMDLPATPDTEEDDGR